MGRFLFILRMKKGRRGRSPALVWVDILGNSVYLVTNREMPTSCHVRRLDALVSGLQLLSTYLYLPVLTCTYLKLTVLVFICIYLCLPVLTCTYLLYTYCEWSTDFRPRKDGCGDVHLCKCGIILCMAHLRLNSNMISAGLLLYGNINPAFVPALDVTAFERLLGPCLEVMRRNLASYDDNMARAFGGKDKISDLRSDI